MKARRPARQLGQAELDDDGVAGDQSAAAPGRLLRHRSPSVTTRDRAIAASLPDQWTSTASSPRTAPTGRGSVS